MPQLLPLQIHQIHPLQNLAREIWEEHYLKIISQSQIDYMLGLFYSTERIKQELKEGILWEILWLADEPIGYLSCRLDHSQVYISKIYLKSNTRGKGYGKLLIKQAVSYAKKYNKSGIYLNVNKYNSDSITFYKNQGFKQVREEVIDIGKGYIMDDYVMGKTIK